MAEILNWRTSPHSQLNDCVEIADNDPSVVRVRDSKNEKFGSLTVSQAAWAEFVKFSKTRAG